MCVAPALLLAAIFIIIYYYYQHWNKLQEFITRIILKKYSDRKQFFEAVIIFHNIIVFTEFFIK